MLRKSRYRLAAALAVAIAAALWLADAGDEAAPAGGEATAKVVVPAVAPPVAGGDGQVAAAIVPPQHEGLTPERVARARDLYLQQAVYPWWSRPLDEGTAYKLTWNEPITSELPFGESGALQYRFGADKMHVMFGEAYTSWIEVYRAGDPTARVPVDIRQAWVMTSGGGRAIPLAFEDDGTHRYVNTFTPSQHEELAHARQVRIEAIARVGDDSRRLVRPFTYAPRPAIEVLGISDRIEAGNLVVELEVQVYEDGLYTFEANAMSGDGALPIAYTDVSQSFEAGRATASLQFFGKAFHDAGVDGPYLVRDIRGFKRDLDGGEHNLWWHHPLPHRTEPYARDELSPAAWDSAEKREKLEHFERLLEETRSGQTGRPR